MKRNGRLSLALHALSHMAHDPHRPHTSSEIAEHIGTNAVVVRRVLGKLREARLLESEKGHAGGWRFASDPKTITFADIYRVIDERLITESERMTSSTCSIEDHLHEKIAGILQKLEIELIEKLADITLFDLNSSTDA